MSEWELSTKPSIAIWMHFAYIIMKKIWHMLDNTESNSKKGRLLGISISNFVDKSYKMKKYTQMNGKSQYE
jgi:hypothetical protein